MRRSFLWVQLAVLALGLVALNVVGGLRLRREVPKLLIRSIDAATPPVNDLFAGNSLMAAGLDLAAYQRGAGGAPRGLNIALAASTAVEHDLLLRRALRLGAGRVFYGFGDTQLTDAPNADFADLGGNRAIVHYLDRETAIGLLAPGDPLTAWRVRLVSHLPLVLDRVTMWARVEQTRRTLGGIGMGPAAASGRFGRVADFGLLEASEEGEFARRCREMADRRAGFSTPVNDMIALAHGHGMRFVLVEMPMRAAHRRRFYATPEWAAYTGNLREQARQAGVDYIAAPDWIGEEGFEDPLHMNPQGAAEFSRRLGEWAASKTR